MNGHSDYDRDSRYQSGSHGGHHNNKKSSGGRNALLICLIISALAVALMGFFVPSDEAKNPIEAFMLFARDGFKRDSGNEPGKDSNSDTDPDTDPDTGTSPGRDETTSPGTGTSDPDETDPPETSVPDEPLDPAEYYKDTLFIGDSRTAGLYIYGRIEGASFFARSSMNVENCFSSTKSETGTGNLSLEAYLKQNTFGKIYILLGINEIGYSYNWIVTRYQKLITRLQELQPEAAIVIQSNMHVTKAKSDANPNSFSNTRINELNRRLSALADGKKVFYLSFESIFDDADGNMNAEYSGDGVHLKAKSYKLWKDYLLSDGMLRLPNLPDISLITNPNYSGGDSEPDETTDKNTEPPTTEPPTTEPPTTEPPTTEPEETDPPITDPDDYFSDALFIGDSRTAGLYLYGGIKQAAFFAKTSATVLTFLNGYETVKPDARMGDKTLSEVLSERKFGKIYLLFGINEISRRSPSKITSDFTELIAIIKEAQPEAKIIIQSNMHVTKAYEQNCPGRGKDRINELNSLLAKLADGKSVFYLSFETLFDDEEGYLREDYSRDGLHFKSSKQYKIWASFIREFGML